MDGTRDRGTTLTEVVLAAAILAIIIVPVVDALGAAIRSSSARRLEAEVDTALVDIAQRLEEAPTACSYDGVLDSVMTSRGWSGSDVTVVYENRPVLIDGTLGPWQAGACATGTAFAQRMTVTVRAPSGTASSIQVVKTDG